MRVLALDLATKTGFANGVAGSKPRSGVKRLKDGGDDPERGFRKLGIWLRDEFSFEKPDLVMIEAPLPVGSMIDWDGGEDKKPKFRSNPGTIYFLNGLVAVVHGICGPYGIMCRQVGVQKVRKHFLGLARPADPKRAVIERCHLLGLMAKDQRDDNQADACALWTFAADTFGNPVARELHLYGEGARQ